MMVQSAKNENNSLSLKIRLKAWWEGYDPDEVRAYMRARNARHTPPPEPVKDPAPPLASDINPDDIELPFDPWDNNRAEIAQYIWGEGYCGPGGPEHIVSMSKLLALSPEQSLLEIGSLLGGPARTLADKFGTWVTGYEASPKLAELAAEKSEMAGLAKKAVIKHYDPEAVKEFDRKFDRAFAKEAMFTIENKGRLLELVEQHLKPSGLFLITDFVLGSESVFGKDGYRDWRDAETQRRRPFMVTADQLVELCKKAGFTVRVNEDVSDIYIDLINKAWAGADKVAEKIGERDDGEELLKTLLHEAEFWSRRAKMLASGDLRLWRVLASKKSEKPSMMSDW